MHEYQYSIVKEALTKECPAKIPISIVQYEQFYAYRISLDDFNSLPEERKVDFAEWLVDRRNAAQRLSGVRVNIEWDED